jgi:urease accessory protein UreF
MNGQASYELAKMRMAENHRWAANERLASEARNAAKAHRDSTEKHEEHEKVGFSLRKLIPHLSSI